MAAVDEMSPGAEDDAWAVSERENGGDQREGEARPAERRPSDGGGRGGRGGRGGGPGRGGRGPGRDEGRGRDDGPRGGDRWGPPRDVRRAPPPPNGGWDRREDRWGPPPPRDDRRDDRWGPPPPRDDRRDDRWGPPPSGYYDSWGRGSSRDDYDSRGGYYDDRYARGPPPGYYDDRDRGYYPPRSPPRGPPPAYYDDRGREPPRRDSYDNRGPPPPRHDDARDGPAYVLDTRGNNGLIVGSRGETVRRIEGESGAKVKCQTDKTTVEIFGSSDAARRAREMIIDILEQNERDKTRRENDGRGGGRERDLRRDLDRLGKRHRDEDEYNGGDKRARGTDSVLEYLRTSAREAGVAKEFPPEYVDASNADERGNVEQSISITNYIGLIIGKEGRMQADIQRIVGIPMQINREEETAVFKGPPEKVGEGLALVREVIETTNALKEIRDTQREARLAETRKGDVEEQVNITGMVGAIVGKKGVRVKYIKDQLRCHFEIDREKEVVTIRGPPEKVELGKQLIAESIERVTKNAQQGGDADMAEEGEQ